MKRRRLQTIYFLLDANIGGQRVGQHGGPQHDYSPERWIIGHFEPKIAHFRTWILGRGVQRGSPESSCPEIDHCSKRFGPHMYIGEVTHESSDRRILQTICFHLGTDVTDNMGVRRVDISLDVGNFDSSGPESHPFRRGFYGGGYSGVARKFGGQNRPFR